MGHDLGVIGLICCNVAAWFALLRPASEPVEPSFPRSCESELRELLQTRADLSWFRSLAAWLVVSGLVGLALVGAVLAYGHAFYIVQIHPIAAGSASAPAPSSSGSGRKGKGQLQ